MTAAVKIEGLSKVYGKRTAVSAIDLEFPAGAITGFLGPNGAGKTTTFRCLLGLARPTSGTMSIFGRNVATDLASIVKSVGAVVEGPALYPTLTGTDNLRVAAKVLGVDESAIPEVIEQVGMTEAANVKVSKYSKGMKQRIALGTALIGDPELLLLDEPMDGLDPGGQRSLRQILRWLVDNQGKTIVISSHVLADVEQLADHVSVINRGRTVDQGKLSDLIGSAKVKVVVDESEEAVALLTAAGMSITKSPGGELLVDTDDSQSVNRVLVEGGVVPRSVAPHANSLEDVFLEMTE